MLDWFTTIPGILIICGVILLVIAVILFVVGAKKSKKEKMANTQSMSEKPVEPAPAMQAPVTESVVNSTPVAPGAVETVNPSVDVTTVNAGDPITVNAPVQVSEPMQVEVAVPEVAIQQPVVETPVMTTEQTVVDIPVMDIPTVSENPAPVVEGNNSTIYGGEAPAVNFSVNEEKPVTIYGGNDPLEATQKLPKVEEHHVPYGGVYPEARVVEPVQSVEMPTPVDEVVSTMPAVEPTVAMNIAEQPLVMDMPSVEPVVGTIPTIEPEMTSVLEVENTQTPSMVAEPTPVSVPVLEVKPVVEEL